MSKTLHTKFGNARVDREYYIITSSKEGNNKKYLHKLIFEDFYGFEVPKQFVVHHKDGNKLNNCILNLQLMRKEDHLSLHHKGLKHSKATKNKISLAKTGKYLGKDNWNYKDNYRVVKLGSPDRTQRYIIIKDKKILKSSTNPLFLSKWFEEYYPNESLTNEYKELGWEVINNYKLRPKGNVGGKKRYCIRYCGKVLKQSISKEKLIKWFEKEYPSEILEICDE